MDVGVQAKALGADTGVGRVLCLLARECQGASAAAPERPRPVLRVGRAGDVPRAARHDPLRAAQSDKPAATRKQDVQSVNVQELDGLNTCGGR